jgi:hypothetical protein
VTWTKFLDAVLEGDFQSPRQNVADVAPTTPLGLTKSLREFNQPDFATVVSDRFESDVGRRFNPSQVVEVDPRHGLNTQLDLI